MPKPNATKQRLVAADRTVSAMRLRQAGYTFDQIARALGYSNRSGAWHAVQAGLTHTLREPAEDLRQIELERLDEMHEGLWAKAIAGDLKAVDGVLAVMRRRSRLLGLDQPRRQVVAADVEGLVAASAREAGLDAGVVWSEAERLLAKLERRSE